MFQATSSLRRAFDSSLELVRSEASRKLATSDQARSDHHHHLMPDPNHVLTLSTQAHKKEVDELEQKVNQLSEALATMQASEKAQSSQLIRKDKALASWELKCQQLDKAVPHVINIPNKSKIFPT